MVNNSKVSILDVALTEFWSQDCFNREAGLYRIRDLALNNNTKIISHLALFLARKASTDQSWVVRSAAAEVLGDIGESSDRNILRELLTDKNWAVRCEAAASLGVLGYIEEKEVLLQHLRSDPSYDVRRYCSTALAELCGIDSVPDLLDAYHKTRSVKLKCAILHALLLADQQRFLPKYLLYLEHPDDRIYETIIVALTRLLKEKDWFGLHLKAIHDSISMLSSTTKKQYLRELIEELKCEIARKAGTSP